MAMKAALQVFKMRLLEVKNLTKSYGTNTVVKNLSVSVKRGEVVGLLGPNGAGKTTTIRHLMGFTNVDRGTCTINGLDCRTQSKEINKSLGYLPGEIAFFDEMTGKQFLSFLQEMRGVKGNSRTQELIQRFDLEVTPRIKKMSKGMKQKLAVIAAFMHDPAVYILDEPSSGLDPLMQHVFVDLIHEEKKRGKTILMSSHNFEEIERTCDRAGIIREGRLVAVEDINSLKAAQRQVFLVTVAGPKDIEHIKAGGLELGKIMSNQVEVVVGSDYDSFIRTLGKCQVRGLDVLPQSLEQVFLKFYGQEVH